MKTQLCKENVDVFTAAYTPSQWNFFFLKLYREEDICCSDDFLYSNFFTGSRDRIKITKTRIKTDGKYLYPALFAIKSSII